MSKKKDIAARQRQAIRRFMVARNLKVSPWCNRAGVSEGTLRAFLKGDTTAIQSDTLEMLALAANSTIQEILGTIKKLIKVWGFVGAGAQIYPIDDHTYSDGLEEVDCPPGADPETTIALRIKGDSMEPAMQDGWHIYYDGAATSGDCSQYLNKLCVVSIKDGPTMLKILKKGYAPGRFNLLSYNASMIEDVELKWCAKVIFIKPS